MTERGGVVVLDFGGQYTQLIARRIREQQVFSSILPCTAPLEEIRKLEPVGMVLSGGPSSVYDVGAPVCDPQVLQLGVPVLGICYGMQWIAKQLGGKGKSGEGRAAGVRSGTIGGAERRIGARLGPVLGAAEIAEDLEQSWRQRAGAAGGIPRDGPHGKCRGGDGRLAAQDLRGAIPSRSEAHGTGQGHSAEFSVSSLRGNAHVEWGGIHSRDCRGDSAEGWGEQCNMRAERRRGLDGGGGACPPGNRRPLDERLCKSGGNLLPSSQRRPGNYKGKRRMRRSNISCRGPYIPT